MYVFVTYGEPGWRGVQVRNLDVAKHFDKKNVLFINGVDSRFIEKEGFKCITVDTSLIRPDDIKIPSNTKAIIFADLPTNELYNLSLFYKAKKEGIPVVIFDNLMRRGQTKEGVFKKLVDSSDIFFFNGLDFMNSENTKKVKVIPPLPEYTKNKNSRNELINKYGIDRKNSILFASGYESDSKKRVNEFYKGLIRKYKNFVLIISDVSIKQIRRTGNKIIVPYLNRDEFLEHLDGADLVLSKFGYLQLLEILALQTPVVIAGKGGYVLETKILDKKLQEVLPYANNPEEMVKIVFNFLRNKKKLKGLVKKITKLHNGQLGGAKKAAEFIKKFSFKKKTLPKLRKNCLILLNDEIKKAESFIKRQEYIYVLGIVASTSKPGPMSVIKRPDEKFLKRQISELLLDQPNEILPHTFKQLYLFSRRKYDGYLDIFPWYQETINNIDNLLRGADTIYITPQAYKLIRNMIGGKIKNKIKKIKV